MNFVLFSIAENIDNKTCNQASKSLRQFPSSTTAQYPSYDYVKPAAVAAAVADELALEEIKALTGSKVITKASHTLNKSDIMQASFGMQYLLLLKRILVCSRRNYVSTSSKVKHKYFKFLKGESAMRYCTCLYMFDYSN